MKFNQSVLDHVLTQIENNLKFSGDDLKEPQSWNFKLDLKVEDVINSRANEAETIRYTIKVLSMLGYIQFAHCDYSVISGITEQGMKFILKRKYEINL